MDAFEDFAVHRLARQRAWAALLVGTAQAIDGRGVGHGRISAASWPRYGGLQRHIGHHLGLLSTSAGAAAAGAPSAPPPPMPRLGAPAPKMPLPWGWVAVGIAHAHHHLISQSACRGAARVASTCGRLTRRSSTSCSRPADESPAVAGQALGHLADLLALAVMLFAIGKGGQQAERYGGADFFLVIKTP